MLRKRPLKITATASAGKQHRASDTDTHCHEGGNSNQAENRKCNINSKQTGTPKKNMDSDILLVTHELELGHLRISHIQKVQACVHFANIAQYNCNDEGIKPPLGNSSLDVKGCRMPEYFHKHTWGKSVPAKHIKHKGICERRKHPFPGTYVWTDRQTHTDSETDTDTIIQTETDGDRPNHADTDIDTDK